MYSHPNVKAPNFLNAQVNGINPKEGALVLFPSFLDHSVNENKSNLDNLMQSRSPILKIEKIKTPIIFFQGMNDPVVQPDQTKKIYDQLILNGIDAKMYLFENEGHGFRMKNTIDKCRFAEEQFFSKHLDMNDA